MLLDILRRLIERPETFSLLLPDYKNEIERPWFNVGESVDQAFESVMNYRLPKVSRKSTDRSVSKSLSVPN